MRTQGRHAAFANSLRFVVILFVLGLPQTMRAQVKAAKPAANTPSQATQNLNPGDDRVIINTDLISFNVTITDEYGRFVTGLQKSAFTILDDKQPQEITFFSDEDAPVSIGIVLDLTGSMSGDKVRRAKEALEHFFQTSLEGDEYSLITLQHGHANLALDRTRDSQALLDRLTFVQPRGTTAFYDACYLGVDKVTHGIYPKRALLVISDGQDNNSRYTFNELRRLVKESDVIIYAIGIEEERDGTLASDGQSILDDIAGVSGGKAFFPQNSAEMDDIFESIALELRHQYAIGYRPPNFNADGKWHHLKVKVNPPRGLPHLFVRSRDGYYALTNAH
jgi:Ca-activated chloride channel family protein